jgi:hypothetical protein
MTGYQSKKAAALDEEGMYLVHQTAHDLATYGTSWTQDGKRIDPMSVYAQPAQEPVAKVCHDLEGHIGWNPKLTELPTEGTELFTAEQRKPLTDEQTVALIKQCRDAFSEELAAYDIDPPIYHVKQGYDNCVNWLAAHGIKE